MGTSGYDIEPSRAAWDALPEQVRADVSAAAHRREPARDLATARAAAAYGRYMQRLWARRIAVLVVVMVVTVIGGIAANTLGWISTDLAAPLMLLIIGGFAAYALLFRAGRDGARIVRVNLRLALLDLALPAEIQLGTANPVRAALGLATVLFAGIVVLPLLDHSQVMTWLLAAALATQLVAFARIGPDAFSLDTLHLDASGIRLDTRGVFVPWTSIASVRESGGRSITIGLSGPVTATGKLPRPWTRRSMSAMKPGTQVRIVTRMPEYAASFAHDRLDTIRWSDHTRVFES